MASDLGVSGHHAGMPSCPVLTQSGHRVCIAAMVFGPLRCRCLDFGGGNETARVHKTNCWLGSCVATRRARTAVGNAGHRVHEWPVAGGAQQQIGTDLRAGDGILMFWSHTPIAPWQNERWLAEMRRSLRPAQYLRMIECRFVTSESSFVDMAAWDRCVDPRLGHAVSDRDLPIWVGVDASIKRDSTAIVAVT
jgi:hypothetical protein